MRAAAEADKFVAFGSAAKCCSSKHSASAAVGSSKCGRLEAVRCILAKPARTVVRATAAEAAACGRWLSQLKKQTEEGRQWRTSVRVAVKMLPMIRSSTCRAAVLTAGVLNVAALASHRDVSYIADVIVLRIDCTVQLN